MSLQEAVVSLNHRVQQQNLWRVRKLRPLDGLCFDSNDYLALRQDPTLIAAYQAAFAQYPAGSGGSQVLSGYHQNHRALESAFADWLQVDACLLFSSGFAANLAITALLGKLEAHCLIAKNVHASIYDGLLLSKVAFSRYSHSELLEKALIAAKGHAAVITEGVFSMSGYQAPLNSLSHLAKNHGASLLVDEAHSLGVLGPEGKGAVASYNLGQQEVPLRILPLGKAFAASGAVVAGQGDWIEALLQTGRSIIYSTAISPALCSGLLKTLETIAFANDKRQRLQQLVAYFKQALGPFAERFFDSPSPIQYLPLGCPQKALSWAQTLETQGIYCSAIRSPTVAPKDSGLRIIIHCQHQEADIDLLVQALGLLLEKS